MVIKESKTTFVYLKSIPMAPIEPKPEPKPEEKPEEKPEPEEIQ